MTITNAESARTRYNTLKDTLQRAADKHADIFKKDGDRVELTQDVRIQVGDDKVIFSKGSVIDNDIKTLDKISTRVVEGEVTNTQSFEHYSERRGFLFKRDQEMLKVSQGEQRGFNFSNLSSTYEI